MTMPFVSVCYGLNKFYLPEPYADYPADRLASTPGDNLIEFSGRLCYASLKAKRARPSCEYHKHIRETKHNSVLAHIVDTFAITFKPEYAFKALAIFQGRPGVWLSEITHNSFRLAISLRAVVEWETQGVHLASPGWKAELNELNKDFYRGIIKELKPKYPLALADIAEEDYLPKTEYDIFSATPMHDTERWCSLYIEGVSRRLLQELVRHHYQANPSVRSTRYVDEGHSNQVMHPEILKMSELSQSVIKTLFEFDLAAYRDVYKKLIEAGVDTKQARGAAGGLLPEATETKLIYSLSLAQAKHILSLRLKQSTGSADQEIVRLGELIQATLRNEPLLWAV